MKVFINLKLKQEVHSAKLMWKNSLLRSKNRHLFAIFDLFGFDLGTRSPSIATIWAPEQRTPCCLISIECNVCAHTWSWPNPNMTLNNASKKWGNVSKIFNLFGPENPWCTADGWLFVSDSETIIFWSKWDLEDHLHLHYPWIMKIFHFNCKNISFSVDFFVLGSLILFFEST